MKREKIEEQAHKFDPWLYANYRESLVEFAIQIHDAALEEAADKAFNRGNFEAVKRIRALKIGAKPLCVWCGREGASIKVLMSGKYPACTTCYVIWYDNPGIDFSELRRQSRLAGMKP